MALGVRFQRLRLWAVVAEHVKIKQKVRTYTPLAKLLDCFINILAGVFVKRKVDQDGETA